METEISVMCAQTSQDERGGTSDSASQENRAHKAETTHQIHRYDVLLRMLQRCPGGTTLEHAYKTVTHAPAPPIRHLRTCQRHRERTLDAEIRAAKPSYDRLTHHAGVMREATVAP